MLTHARSLAHVEEFSSDGESKIQDLRNIKKRLKQGVGKGGNLI